MNGAGDDVDGDGDDGNENEDVDDEDAHSRGKIHGCHGNETIVSLKAHIVREASISAFDWTHLPHSQK